MEKIEQKRNWKDILMKYLPLIFTLTIVLAIGLSMIGPFFDIRLKADGQKIDTVYRLTDLLFTSPAGTTIQVLFIVTYLVLPLVACGFVFLGKLHNNFYVVAILLFLLIAITCILTNDVVATSLSETTGDNYSTHGVHFCFVLPIIVFFVAGTAVLILASRNITITVSDLTEMGILVGLALALNFVKIVQFRTGGSVNFQMVPLFILALRKGPLKGFIGAGIAYGLISCITDGYGIATYPFDYLIGFGSACVLGFFTKYIFGEDQTTYNLKGLLFLFVGGLISTFIRYVGGCASSMIIYGYTLLPAMSYNLIYVSVSGAIGITVIMGIYGPFIKVNRRFPSNNNKSST